MNKSEIIDLGPVTLPAFTGLRIMMMPFRLHDPETVPPVWRAAVESMVLRAPTVGVGYLTIDEALVQKGTTHRRPGLHVDGVGPEGHGGWGGSAPWAKNGMLTAASILGARGYVGTYTQRPLPNGDCAYFIEDCKRLRAVDFEAGHVYWCSPLALHEALPMEKTVRRQFARISMPSDAPWYEGYTPSPYGVLPTGPIHPERREFMDYRRS